MVDLDGAHPRSLCETHAKGVRLALEQPGTYKVSWGKSKADQIADLESKIPAAQAQLTADRAALAAYGPPHEDDYSFEDPAHRKLSDAEWYAEVELSNLHGRIAELSARTWDHPIVRVEVRTDR